MSDDCKSKRTMFPITRRERLSASESSSESKGSDARVKKTQSNGRLAQGGRQSSLPLPQNTESKTRAKKTTYRLVVLGAAGVGKTAIINRFLYEKFVKEYRATVDELHRGEFEVCGSNLTLDILDTSGAYSFPAMRRLSISTGDAFILVYSLKDKESLEEVRSLRDQIIEAKGPCVPIVVVANKADSPVDDDAPIPSESDESTADTGTTLSEPEDTLLGHPVVQSSALDDMNIVGIFRELLLQLDGEVGDAFSPGIRRRCVTFLPKGDGCRKKGKVVKHRSCHIQ